MFSHAQYKRKREGKISRHAFFIFYLSLLVFTSNIYAADNRCIDNLEPNRREIRNFVLVNYRPLVLNLRLRSGEHLDALCKLTNDTKCSLNSLFIEEISLILDNSTSVTDFAKKVSYSKNCKS